MIKTDNQSGAGVISIEGNLGAGKSTLLSLLDVNILKQPVDEWLDMGGSNILQKYYNDAKRWAFTFQLNALHSRCRIWREQIKIMPRQSFVFSERSPLADRYIFGEIMHHQGNMDAAEYAIYDSLCTSLMAGCPLSAIIYLRCSPDVCLERIKSRNRKGEESIPIDYIRKVHLMHEKWLSELKGVPILVIDTGAVDIQSLEGQQEIIKQIQQFVFKVGGKSEEVKIKRKNSEIEPPIKIEA